VQRNGIGILIPLLLKLEMHEPFRKPPPIAPKVWGGRHLRIHFRRLHPTRVLIHSLASSETCSSWMLPGVGGERFSVSASFCFSSMRVADRRGCGNWNGDG
jgi:hypothetical protein